MKKLKIERTVSEFEELEKQAKKLGIDISFYYNYVSEHKQDDWHSSDRDHDEMSSTIIKLTLGKSSTVTLKSTNGNPYVVDLQSTALGYYGAYSGISNDNLPDLIEAVIVSDYCYHKLSHMIGKTENTKYAAYLKNLNELKNYGKFPEISDYFSAEEIKNMHDRAMAYASVDYEKVQQKNFKGDIKNKVLREMSLSAHDELNLRTIMKKLNLGYSPLNYTPYPRTLPTQDEHFAYYHAFENNIISTKVLMAREIGDYPQTYEAYQLVVACGKQSRIIINTAESSDVEYKSKLYDSPLTIELGGKTLKFKTLSGVQLYSLYAAVSRYEYCANKIKFMPASMAKQSKYYVAMQRIEKALDALEKGSVREINGFQDNILNDAERYEIKKASQAAATVERLQEKGVKIKTGASLNEIYDTLSKKELKQHKATAKNKEKYEKLKLAKSTVKQADTASKDGDELVK